MLPLLPLCVSADTKDKLESDSVPVTTLPPSHFPENCHQKKNCTQDLVLCTGLFHAKVRIISLNYSFFRSSSIFRVASFA
jgi:hypothetical protein